MKKITLILLILRFSSTFGQKETPFFEQIAFDLYKTEIIKKFPAKGKVKISKYTTDLHDIHFIFYVNECLKGKYLSEKKELIKYEDYASRQLDLNSLKKEISFDGLNKKEFKIKKRKTESIPYLRISQPYHEKNNFEDFYVNILEFYDTWVITYFVLIDKNGKVKSWCQEK